MRSFSWKLRSWWSRPDRLLLLLAALLPALALSQPSYRGLNLRSESSQPNERAGHTVLWNDGGELYWGTESLPSVTGTPSTNNVPLWNGANWVPSMLTDDTVSLALDDLTDVTAAGPSTGDGIAWSGAAWTSGPIDADTLDTLDSTAFQPVDAALTSLSGIGDSFSDGDLIRATGTNALTAIAPGTDSHVLTMSGGVPTWAAIGLASAADKVEEFARKATAGTITAGTPVVVVSYNPSGFFEVEAADCDNPARMPASGVAAEDITNTATATFVTFGRLTGVDTSAFSVPDKLYVSDAETLTATRPSNTDDAVQKVGSVLRSHPTAGVIFVSGANRSNDVPNLATDSFWYGSGNIATEATVTAFIRSVMDDADAGTARGTLSAQESDASLTSFAGNSWVAGDLPIVTGVDTISRLAKGTDGEVLSLSSGLPSWGAVADASVPNPYTPTGGTWALTGSLTIPNDEFIGTVANPYQIKLNDGSTAINDRLILYPNATTGGLSIGTLSGDPTSVGNGALWYSSAGSGDLRAYVRGAAATVWTSGTDGSSSGLDADLLDGETASAFQDQNAGLDSLSGISASLVADDLLIATAANTLARLAKGSEGNVLTVVGGSVEWGSVDDSSVPDPYTPPDGTWNLNGHLYLTATNPIITLFETGAGGSNTTIRDWGIGQCVVTTSSDAADGASVIQFDALVGNTSSNAEYRFGPNTSTTGSNVVKIYKGDGTSSNPITLNGKTGDITSTYGTIEGASFHASSSGTAANPNFGLPSYSDGMNLAAHGDVGFSSGGAYFLDHDISNPGDTTITGDLVMNGGNVTTSSAYGFYTASGLYASDSTLSLGVSGNTDIINLATSSVSLTENTSISSGKSFSIADGYFDQDYEYASAGSANAWVFTTGTTATDYNKTAVTLDATFSQPAATGVHKYLTGMDISVDDDSGSGAGYLTHFVEGLHVSAQVSGTPYGSDISAISAEIPATHTKAGISRVLYLDNSSTNGSTAYGLYSDVSATTGSSPAYGVYSYAHGSGATNYGVYGRGSTYGVFSYGDMATDNEGSITADGPFIAYPDSFTITGGTNTIPSDQSLVKLVAYMSGNYTMTSNPSIAAGTQGQVIVVAFEDDASGSCTLQDSVASYGLELAGNWAGYAGDTITLVYINDGSNSYWNEISRSNN